MGVGDYEKVQKVSPEVIKYLRSNKINMEILSTVSIPRSIQECPRNFVVYAIMILFVIELFFIGDISGLA